MTLNVFDLGIDYSGARPTMDAVKGLGLKFIMRYSAGVASNPSHADHHRNAWKLCGLDEIKNAVAAGVDFVAISEWYQTRVLEGYNKGFADGTADLAFWKARGLAKGAAIYYAFDASQPAVASHAGLGEYLRGVAEAQQGYYVPALYAGNTAVDAMFAAGRIRFGCLAMSRAWSPGIPFTYKPGLNNVNDAKKIAPLTRACLLQNGNRHWGTSTDEDIILRLPIGSHMEAIRHNGNIPVTVPQIEVPKKTVLLLATEAMAGLWGNGADRKHRLTLAGYDYFAVQAEINRRTGHTTPTTPTLPPKPTTPAQKTITDIAREVIRGDWGNGAAREMKLTKAGYNYDLVQAEVHKLLGKPAPIVPVTKTVSQLADEVIRGLWGNGADRVNRLRAAGYNPAAVQAAVNARTKG